VLDALIQAGFGEHIKGPVNVASGQGITIHELAIKVLTQTASQVPLQHVRRHSAEVVRFVADITRAKNDFNIDRTEDPLSHLDELIAFTRDRFTARRTAGVTSIPLKEMAPGGCPASSIPP
jgi:UDP-glucose 4-epimerase